MVTHTSQTQLNRTAVLRHHFGQFCPNKPCSWHDPGYSIPLLSESPLYSFSQENPSSLHWCKTHVCQWNDTCMYSHSISSPLSGFPHPLISMVWYLEIQFTCCSCLLYVHQSGCYQLAELFFPPWIWSC